MIFFQSHKITSVLQPGALQEIATPLSGSCLLVKSFTDLVPYLC